jgi:hypothetical protein
MKSYEEMINFAATQVDGGCLKHLAFAAHTLLGEAYGKSEELVRSDLSAELEKRLLKERALEKTGIQEDFKSVVLKENRKHVGLGRVKVNC